MSRPGKTLLVNGGIDSVSANLTSANSFTNAGTITLENAVSSSSYYSYLVVSSGVLTNTGTINVNKGTGGYRQILANFDNQCVININTNTEIYKASGIYTNTGTFNIASGTTLTINGYSQVFNQDGGVLNNGGTFDMTSATFNFNDGAITGTLNLTSSKLNIADTAVAPVTFSMRSSCNLTGNVKAGQTLRVNGGIDSTHATLTSATSFTNAGTITLENAVSSSSYYSYLVVSSGVLTNTGTININKGTGGLRTITGQLNNQGLVRVESPITCNFSTGPVENTASGTFAGNGSFNLSIVSFTNRGTISPGLSSLSTGILTISNKLVNQSTAVVHLKIDGLTVGSGYDRLAIDGPMTFNGTLDVDLMDFTPSVGNTFTVMTYTSYTGSFNMTTLPALPGDMGWVLEYQPTALILKVIRRDANLAITQTDSPDPTFVNTPLIYDIQVSNLGPDSAHDLIVTDTLPANVTFNFAASVSGTWTCSEADGVVTCSLLDALDKDQSAALQIAVTPTLPGATLTNTATVSAVEYDIDNTDNTAQAITLVENRAPVALDDAYTTDEDTAFDIPAPGVLENDFDPDGTSLTAAAWDWYSTKGARVTINSDGSFHYDPTAASQLQALHSSTEPVSDTFTYRVNDGHGGSDTATVTVTVSGINDSPVAAADAYTIAEDDILSVASPGILSNDHDAENQPLAVIASDASTARGIPVTVNSDGSFTFDPTGAAVFQDLEAGESLDDTFNYTVSDGQGGTASATVTITVTGANDPPVAVLDSYTTDEDTALAVAAPGLLANDTDADGHSLSATAADFYTAKGALVSIHTDGAVSYDPLTRFQALAVGETATDSFTYTISDGKGGTDIGTVEMTINGVNDAPIANDNSASTDINISINLAGLLNNDTDRDTSDILAISSVDSNGTRGIVTLEADGTVTYNPNGQFSGLNIGESTTDTFQYTVSDGHQGFDTATVTITVMRVNALPVAGDDTYGTDEDTILSVPAPGVLGNDTDTDGDSLSVSSFDNVSSSGASISMNANGSFSYNPRYASALQALNPGNSLVDTFTYTITDTRGGTATATVRVTVTGRSEPPVTAGDFYNIDEDTALVIGSPGVLSNDSDPEGGPLMVIEYMASSNRGATVAVNLDGSFTYDPTGTSTLQALPEGNSLSDWFTYTVSDEWGEESTETVTIRVDGRNDNPKVMDDTSATSENALLVVSPPGVLENDTDPEGDPLTIVSYESISANGAVVKIFGDGSYTFDPRNAPVLQALRTGQTLPDTFHYTVSDGIGGQAVQPRSP